MFRENMEDVFNSEPTISLFGTVAPKVLEKVSVGLPPLDDKNIKCFFVPFSRFNIKTNKKFDVIFDEDKPKSASFLCRTQLYGVTQQYGKSFYEIGIPQGWKTIVAIKFLDKIPTLIEEMPSLETWFERKGNGRVVILSSNQFYDFYCTEFINQNNIEE